MLPLPHQRAATLAPRARAAPHAFDYCRFFAIRPLPLPRHFALFSLLIAAAYAALLRHYCR